MGNTNISEQIGLGGVILGRLGNRAIPTALKAYVATFKAHYGSFEKASQVADAARDKRDEALEKVGDKDDFLDADLESLAAEMVGAKMGKRANPFRDFSRHAPGHLVRLPYATEATEVLSLVLAIGKKKPAAAVAKAAAKCKASAQAVQSALADLTHPQTAYSTAMAARDALLPGCLKALRKLKTQARAAWDDEPGVYQAIFAPPDKVQAPKAKRSSKKINGPGKAATAANKGTAPVPA